MTLSGVQPTPPSFPPSAVTGHLGQQVLERTLPQGPRLLMVERHTVPLVYFSWVAPAGVRHEPPGLEGIANLAANTLGGGRSGLITAVDRDCAVLGIGGLNDEVANSLDTLFDALLEPEIDASAFETLRSRLLHELEQRRRQLDSLAGDLLAWALFGAGPDGRPQLGLPSSLQRMDPTSVRRFVEQRRTAPGATLLITGDFDSQRIGDYLETLAPATLEPLGMESSGPPEGSAALNRTPSRSLWDADGDTASTTRPILVADLPEARHSVVRVGWPGPSATRDDVFIARTLAALLAGPVSSRLGDRLRHREGWVYHIAAELPLRLGQAPFTLAASLAHDRVAPVLDAIRDEVAMVQQEGPREREVEGLRTYLTGVGLCGCQTLLNTLGRLRRTALDGADPLQRELNTLAGITADDLQNLARRVLDPSRRVEVVVGPLRQLRPTLETLGPLIEVDPSTFFDPEAGREPKHLRS